MEISKDLIRIVTGIIDNVLFMGIPAAELVALDIKSILKSDAFSRAIVTGLQLFIKSAYIKEFGSKAECLMKILEQDKKAQEGFRKMFKEALDTGKPEHIEVGLSRLLDQCGFSEGEKIEAVDLFIQMTLGSLWEIDSFREKVAHLKIERLESKIQILEKFRQSLPQKVREILKELEVEKAWEILQPALLPQGRVKKLSPDNLLEALRAPYQLIPFVGATYQSLLEELENDVTSLSHDKTHIWIISGAGGSGKTRLVVELAERLQNKGWKAYFLPEEMAWNMENIKHWMQPKSPTLLILDYAEHRSEKGLKNLLGEYKTASYKRRNPLALVLIMRPKIQDKGAAPVKYALDASLVPKWSEFPIPQPDPERDRLKIFETAKQVFCKHGFGKENGVNYKPDELPPTPLSIIALAFLAVQSKRVAKSEDEFSVLLELWERWEKARRWSPFLRPRSDIFNDYAVLDEAMNMIEKALVAATLGYPFKKAEDIASWWNTYFPPQAITADSRSLDPRWLAQRMPDLFPAHDETWQLRGIVPDPLADVVMVKMGDKLGEILKASLPGASEIEKNPVSTVQRVEKALVEILPRLLNAPKGFNVATKAVDKALSWLEEIGNFLKSDAGRKSEAVRLFLNSLDNYLPSPERTTVLRKIIAKYYELMLENAEDEEKRARWLNNLGMAYSKLGKRKKALKVTEEAVRIKRELVKKNRDAFLPYLASSLNNLGAMLSDLGRKEEALEVTRKAVGIRRKLAEKNPDAFMPDLAMSLNNLGKMLSDLGGKLKWEEALEKIGEAVGIYRKLAEKNPDAFMPDLAMSLNNLGAMLSYLGKREKASEVTREAVEIYRKLAEKNPDAFMPDLAMSLNNLGKMLSDLGGKLKWEEALKVTGEAVDIYRELAEKNPDAFNPYLAGSLNNLGTTLSDLGRREEALKATQEAVDIYRKLAEKNPDAFMPYLATSLNNLGTTLSDLRRKEEALEVTREAVEIRRKLAEKNPDAFLPDLAMSLSNLGNRLSDLGRGEEALEVTREAVEIRRKLADKNPDAFLPDLASGLNNLGNRLSDLGKWEEAFKVTGEAVDIYRELAKKNPDAFMPGLSRSLGSYARALLLSGKPEEAVRAIGEAIKILMPYAKAIPQAFGGLMSTYLKLYRIACIMSGKKPDPHLLNQAKEFLPEK